jgi:hypothetical protein
VRRLIFVADFTRYTDACIAADSADEETGDRHVIWDSDEERLLRKVE